MLNLSFVLRENNTYGGNKSVKNKRAPKKAGYTIKDFFAEFFGELLVYAMAFAIGTGIVALLPYEKLKNVPFEFLMFLGLLILIILAGLVIVAVGVVLNLKNRKKSKDIRFIYKELKKRYPLILMNVTKIVDEKMVNSPTIRGKNAEGKFDLFKENDKFVFSIRYNTNYSEKEGFCAYPCDVNEAIELIKTFMSGDTLDASTNN